MKIQGRTDDFICADGKFFAKCGSTGDEVARFRQIELFLPAAPGTLGVPIDVTMALWLSLLQEGVKKCRWAIGSTGGQLTARYQIRADGELVSELALNGGMKQRG